jgi:ATP-dependent exoDNAse (exonuclease V) beta subunit
MTVLADTDARAHITHRLDRTLFVEAGAGSGKTRSLVERAIAIILEPDDPVPLRNLAIVTFTEKAGAELRDRIREALEKVVTAEPGTKRAGRATEALADLDTAAIGTLHSFAQRILSEHPVEAGLPPLIEVLDEVGSGVAFDHRWEALRAELLDDEDVSQALLLAMAAGMKLDDLRSMAHAFTDNWDLLTERVLAQPMASMPRPDVAPFIPEARRLAGLRRLCTTDADRLLLRLDRLGSWADRLAVAPDDAGRFALMQDLKATGWQRIGNKNNWPRDYPIDRIRAECAALGRAVEGAHREVMDGALRTLARRVALDTLGAAQARRDDGRLEFHDLLVLARELLRHPQHGRTVRAVLQQRYQRLLLDEFQDTDPIQIELAARIAGGAAADAPGWQDVVVPDGRLFVVGDPKQSIYRFRRADIATYLDAQDRIGEGVVLETNFRTTAPVLEWVNHVFGRLITPEPGSQPAYRSLHAARVELPAGPPVVVTGIAEHGAGASADEIRAREAADVVTAVQIAVRDPWQVQDGDGWRDVRLDDIAVLVPARTSLPQLESALDAAGLPYRAEASSLVYRTQEVRDLLMTARAADDPSDQLALVSALRTPLFGCGDDDLWTWYQAGGRWNILAPVPDDMPDGHPVRDAVTWLKRLHNDRTWLAPSEVLSRVIDERRVLEAAADGPRARDVWRQLRFVVDQARAWSENQRGGLRNYLAWARRQGDEAARVAEAILPETDTNTLRIMTIHAAKGLEFPVVILSGMSSQPSSARSGVDVLWPPSGGCEFKLRKDLQTSDFEYAKPIDEQMGYHERLRLLYVACTRARDHLVVSLHRRERRSPPRNPHNRTNAEVLAEAAADAPSQHELSGVSNQRPGGKRPALSADPPPPWPQWSANADAIQARSDRPSSVSASQFEGTLDAPAPAAGPPSAGASAIPDATGGSAAGPPSAGASAAPDDISGSAAGPPSAGASAIPDDIRGSAAGPTPRLTPTDRLDRPTDPGLDKGARDLELPPWNKGRYGTAVGRAVHGVLQSVDLATGHGLDDAVAAQSLAEGVADDAEVVRALARSALDSDIVREAASRRFWRETYVGTVVAGRVLEGFIDLVYEDDDGLVVVDYKTDTVPVAAIDQRVAFYRPQVAAYVMAIQAATGRPAVRGVLLFLSPSGAVARPVVGLDDAIAALRTEISQPE